MARYIVTEEQLERLMAKALIAGSLSLKSDRVLDIDPIMACGATLVPEWATHFARRAPLDDWEPYSDPEHVFQLKEISDAKPEDR